MTGEDELHWRYSGREQKKKSHKRKEGDGTRVCDVD